MGKKCSQCGNMGHNSRTCTISRGTIVVNTTNSSSGLRIFGVQIDISSSSSSSSSSPCIGMNMNMNMNMKKSFSVDCLSSPLLASSSSSPSSSLSSSRVSVNETSDKASFGYLSDGLLARAQERKKGVAWTEEEHRSFLSGLEKLGKGDWRGISRNFVTTRTPTQVASHAQKYFLRQATLHNNKRRSSLFDMDPASAQYNLSIARSSYDEPHHQHNNMHLIDINSFGQDIRRTSSYHEPDLELTLAAPMPMDPNKSSIIAPMSVI